MSVNLSEEHMSDFESAVGIFYGPYFDPSGEIHPYRDRIYRNIHEYQRGFSDKGLELIAMSMLEPPQEFEEQGRPPRVGMYRNITFDKGGTIIKADFEEGDIRTIPAIIDHGVAVFHGEKTRYPDINKRKAFGLGLPLDRLWNPWPIQDMGNDKDLTEDIVSRLGVGIPTYKARDFERFADERGDSPVIYKPRAGSQGYGIQVFPSLKEFEAAAKRYGSNIDPEGHIQPYLDLTDPIPGLKAREGDDEASEKLKIFNSDKSRQREIRMHIIVDTDDSGKLTVEAYPTLKYGEPGRQYMKVAGNIALDKDSIPEEHPVHEACVQIGAEVKKVAERHSGKEIRQFYGNADVVNAKGKLYIGDVNMRGPAIAEEAHDARGSLIEHVGNTALRNRDQAA
jgi:hypothetical protein